jgi:hypothetical protein
MVTRVIVFDFSPTNDRDQRAAEVDIDFTINRTTAAPLHPMVRALVVSCT